MTLLITCIAIATVVFRCLALNKTEYCGTLALVPYYGDWCESRSCTSTKFAAALLVTQILITFGVFIVIYNTIAQIIPYFAAAGISSDTYAFNANDFELLLNKVLGPVLVVIILAIVDNVLRIFRSIRFAQVLDKSGAWAVAYVFLPCLYYGYLALSK